jgi:hypothetical protein
VVLDRASEPKQQAFNSTLLPTSWKFRIVLFDLRFEFLEDLEAMISLKYALCDTLVNISEHRDFNLPTRKLWGQGLGRPSETDRHRAWYTPSLPRG